jgi:type IV conjugative transfer system protein TraE
MRLNVKQKLAVDLLKQRNFSYSVVLFLMAVTLLLLIKLWSSKERIIVVPHMGDPHKHYLIDGDHVPDTYLVDWASSLLSDLWTASPATVDQKNARFLTWAMSTSTLSADLQKTAALLKKEQVSTAFFPESFAVNRTLKHVLVTGRFLSYFGKSQTPVVREKTFRLGWTILPGGQIAIQSLDEATETKGASR